MTVHERHARARRIVDAVQERHVEVRRKRCVAHLGEVGARVAGRLVRGEGGGVVVPVERQRERGGAIPLDDLLGEGPGAGVVVKGGRECNDVVGVVGYGAVRDDRGEDGRDRGIVADEAVCDARRVV